MKPVFSVLLIFFSTAPAFGQIPSEVATRITAAQSYLDPGSFVGSYTMTNNSVVEKTNGKDRKEVEVVMEIAHTADGGIDGRLIRMVENGKDVTEKRRPKIEKQMAEQQGSDSGEGDQELIGPFDGDADRFVFSQRRVNGNTVEVSFEPSKKHQGTDRISSGTVAWDDRTLYPIRVEMTTSAPPKPLKELSVLLEFSNLGDRLYVSRFHTTGLAKILLIKRRFESEIAISDLKPSL